MEPLIKVEPQLLVNKKKGEVFAKGGDVLLPGGAKVQLPGGFQLPTTGLFSYLLDIPDVRAPCCTPAAHTLLAPTCMHACVQPASSCDIGGVDRMSATPIGMKVPRWGSPLNTPADSTTTLRERRDRSRAGCNATEETTAGSQLARRECEDPIGAVSNSRRVTTGVC